MRAEMEAGLLRLVITAGNQRGKVFDLAENKGYILGRGEDVQVPILDIVASRKHAEISVGPGDKASFRDLGSANGTVVNGKDVKRAELQDGDRLVIGETEILVTWSADAGPVATHRTTAIAADTDMTEFMSRLVFCEKCNESIPMSDVDKGKAAEIDGKFYCSRCLKEMSDAEEK